MGAPWPLMASVGAVALGALLWPRASGASALPSAPSRATDLPSLRGEYLAAWDAATIRPERLASVGRIVDVLVSSRARYEVVERMTGVPWFVVAVLHSLEGGGSSGRFTGHLHNGDSLSARTTHVPAGKPTAPPAAGEGHPYTWEESAADALARWRGATDWSLPAILWRLERYNGTGTRARGLWTPYLWSFTTLYTRGKFVADGVWSDTAVSAQAGGAALLKVMTARGLISLAR